MGRPATTDSGIDIECPLEELLEIYNDYLENKIEWMLKLGKDQYIRERDRIRQAIRRKKMGKENFNEYTSNIRKDMVARNRKLIEEEFGLICSVCGFSGHHSQIDFHHTDSTKKENNIGWLIWRSNFNKIREELKKCIPICANCHRLLHWKENNEE